MNFEHLRTFYAVATKKSFTKAARSLFITQSAVSQQMKALEHSLGCSLFNRENRKVFLTTDGVLLLNYSTKFFDIYEEITSLFNSRAVTKKGKISLASTRVIGTSYLSKLIVHFIKQNPGIEVYFRLNNSHTVLDMVLEGNVMFGIAGDMRTPSGIKKIMLHQEKLIAISSPHHHLAHSNSVSAEEIAETPFIWREKGTHTREIITNWFLENTNQKLPAKSIVLGQLEAVKQFIEEGYGITFIPEVAVENEIKENKIVQINVKNFNHYVNSYLYFFEEKTLSKSSLQFLKLVFESNMFSHSKNIAKINNHS